MVLLFALYSQLQHIKESQKCIKYLVLITFPSKHYLGLPQGYATVNNKVGDQKDAEE